MTTKEIYKYGTKPENPVREIHPFLKEAQGGIYLDNDISWYQKELQSLQDEVSTLEREINDLHTQLFDRDEEIEELNEELDELKIRLETFESVES